MSLIIKQLPYYRWLYRDRGWAYGEIGEYSKAKADLAKVIELDANDLETWCRLSACYADREEYEKAIENCGKALKLNPNHDWANEIYNIRGYSYGESGQYEKALDDLNKSIELAPSEERSWTPGVQQAYKNRGTVYKYLKQYDKAKKDCDKALEIDPDYMEARELLDKLTI